MNGQLDIGGIRPTHYFFSIAIVLGLLFALVSADQDRSGILQFAQWQLQTLVPMALLIASHTLLLQVPRFASLNPWLALCISGVIGATLFAPFALGIDLWIEPLPDSANLLAEFANEWGSVVPPVAIAWVALNAPWQLGYRLEKPRAKAHADGPEPRTLETPEFFEMIAPEKRGRILFLKSELHYLQVCTTTGNSLILYNLGDAIAQLPAQQGIAVHRSYWVAFDAIEKLTRQGRQGEIELRDGQLLPVSRNRLREVEQRLAGHCENKPTPRL